MTAPVFGNCGVCDGKGWNWVAPNGFNPFLAGRPAECHACRGTGSRTPLAKEKNDG